MLDLIAINESRVMTPPESPTKTTRNKRASPIHTATTPVSIVVTPASAAGDASAGAQSRERVT